MRFRDDEVGRRVRSLPPPPVRSYARKPVPSYPRSSSKREFVSRDELPPRSRVPLISVFLCKGLLIPVVN
ncbi:hypothetical protein FRX31_033676, partial [Thalictrum thalictroides]